MKTSFAAIPVALCVLAWGTAGLFKVLAPTRLTIAGTSLDLRWTLVLGLAELALAAALVFRRSRPTARVCAFVLIATFLLAWRHVPDDCGCLGALHLDRAGRTVLIGVLLTLHGVELLVSAGRTRLRELPHAP